MAKVTERTSFTKDVEGRYLCNDISEVNAWKSAGGRPFDVIVVGGGTFGSAIAEHICSDKSRSAAGFAPWSSKQVSLRSRSMSRTPASKALPTHPRRSF